MLVASCDILSGCFELLDDELVVCADTNYVQVNSVDDANLGLKHFDFIDDVERLAKNLLTRQSDDRPPGGDAHWQVEHGGVTHNLVDLGVGKGQRVMEGMDGHLLLGQVFDGWALLQDLL